MISTLPHLILEEIQNRIQSFLKDGGANPKLYQLNMELCLLKKNVSVRRVRLPQLNPSV